MGSVEGLGRKYGRLIGEIRGVLGIWKVQKAQGENKETCQEKKGEFWVYGKCRICQEKN